MRCLPLAIALLVLPAHAATVLEPNDVQIVAFASDAPDAFVSRINCMHRKMTWPLHGMEMR